MRKYLFLTIAFIIFMLPSSIKAETCDYVEYGRLSKIADNINSYTDYFEKENSVTFSATFYNLRPNVFVKDMQTNRVYSYGEQGADQAFFTIYDLQPNKTYKFELFTDLTSCTNRTLRTVYVNTPYYNSFYSDKVCEGLTDYELCGKWYKHNLNYTDFVKTVENYKESLIPIEEKPTDNDTNIYYEYIINFLTNYYFYFLIAIIIIGSATIFYLDKKDDFDLST